MPGHGSAIAKPRVHPAKMLWLAVQIRCFALIFVDGVMAVGLVTVFRQLFQISGPLTSLSVIGVMTVGYMTIFGSAVQSLP